MKHEDIFFPSDREKLEKLLGDREKKDFHSALIVPHMGLEGCADLYREVFSHIEDGQRITLLLPLHREPLLKDGDTFIWESTESVMDTPCGKVSIVKTGLPSSPAYESEEYTAELFSVCCAYFNPSSPVRILWTYVHTSDQVKKLVRLLEKDRNDDDVYVVSSNLTGEIPENEIEEKKRDAVEIIESGVPLLDLVNKGRMKACGAGLIEAVSRIVDGRWTLLGTVNNEKCVAHAAFCRI